MAGAGLALLACITLIGLTASIYHRDKTSISLSHMIMVCIGVLVAGLALAVFFMTKSAFTKRLDPNHLLIGLALLLCLTMFVYFLGSTIYYYMYRPFHFGNLIQRNSD